MYKYHLVEHSGREYLTELLDRSYFILRKIKKITEVIDNCKKCYILKPI
jgi:H2C2 zinc finger